jgi:hypothetical protein
MEELVGVLEYVAAALPEHLPSRADKGVDVSPASHASNEPNPELSVKDSRTKTENGNPHDVAEHLDSWATESWLEESVEGHRDGVTCVEWTDDLVLTGGRSI